MKGIITSTNLEDIPRNYCEQLTDASLPTEKREEAVTGMLEYLMQRAAGMESDSW